MHVNGVGSGRVSTTDSYQTPGHVHTGRANAGKNSDVHALPSASSQHDKTKDAGTGQTAGGSEKGGIKHLFSEGRAVLMRIWNGGQERNQAELYAPELRDGGRHGADSLWQRFKIKVYTATGYLAKKFGRETAFHFSPKQGKDGTESRGEQLSGRHRRGLRAGSSGNDKSFLMDSYDRSGRYTRLGQGTGDRRPGQGVDIKK